MGENAMMELQREYQEKAHALQADFQSKLQIAQSKGDIAALQQFSVDFQKESLALVDWYNQRLAELTQAKATGKATAPVPVKVVTDADMDIYSHDYCDLSMNQVAYRGDRDQMRRFLNDIPFTALIRDVTSHRTPGNVHKRLLAHAMRLTPKIAPDLFRLVDKVKQAVGLKVELTVFAVQDTTFNAGCYPISDGRLPIYLTSGMLEKFNDGELTFVLGHEVAHALLDHFRIPVSLLLDVAADHIAPAQAIRLRAWERNGEISADRVGLLCCRSFDDAASAFFKMSSGIVSKQFSFKVEEYMGQYADLEKYLKEADERDAQDLYSSHPFNPIRMKALQVFWESELYKQFAGGSSGSISKADLEKRIHSFVKLVEPTYLDAQDDNARMIREFIFYAGFLIARADGVVDQSELNQLASFLDATVVAEGVGKLQSLSTDEIVRLIEERSQAMNRHLPFVAKLNVIRDLSTVVQADGKITDDEMYILSNVCQTLGINPMFAEELIAQAMERQAA